MTYIRKNERQLKNVEERKWSQQVAEMNDWVFGPMSP